jgi:hypothetical protein
LLAPLRSHRLLRFGVGHCFVKRVTSKEIFGLTGALDGACGRIGNYRISAENRLFSRFGDNNFDIDN